MTLALLVAIATGVWVAAAWVASVDARLHTIEDCHKRLDALDVRLASIESRILLYESWPRQPSK